MYEDESSVIYNELGLIDVNPNLSLANEALNLDIRTLDNISDVMLTKYMVSLTQYNVYLQMTYNKYYMLKKKLEQMLEIQIKMYSETNKIKRTTKKDLKIEACLKDDSIALLSAKLDAVTRKVTLLEGTTKYIDSYVNALKKDLVRRRIEIGGG